MTLRRLVAALWRSNTNRNISTPRKTVTPWSNSGASHRLYRQNEYTVSYNMTAAPHWQDTRPCTPDASFRSVSRLKRKASLVSCSAQIPPVGKGTHCRQNPLFTPFHSGSFNLCRSRFHGQLTVGALVALSSPSRLSA